MIRNVTKAEMSQQEKNREIKKIICDTVLKQMFNSKQNIKGALPVKDKKAVAYANKSKNPKTKQKDK